MRPISKKVLNQHLRRMEKDGLILRTEMNGKIPHVEYALTTGLGCFTLRLLQTIARSNVQNTLCATSGDLQNSLDVRTE